MFRGVLRGVTGVQGYEWWDLPAGGARFVFAVALVVAHHAAVHGLAPSVPFSGLQFVCLGFRKP